MGSSGVQSVPVLMYHEINDPAEAFSGLAVSPAMFREQLAYLADAGYATVTAGEFAASVAEGRSLPPRTVVLTFDDGFADFHRHAVPALSERGFVASVFVTTGWIQDAGGDARRPGRMLSWSQVGEVLAAGMEVGGHSACHPQLDQLPASRLRDELYVSKASLQDKLGIPIPGVAYPFGYSSAQVRAMASDAGYSYGYAVANTMANHASDLFRLPRLTVHHSTSLAELGRLVNGGLALTMVRDRALTATWSVVRRSKRVLAAATGRRDAV